MAEHKKRFRIEFTVEVNGESNKFIEDMALQELKCMSPYPEDITFSEVGSNWHTGTPTENGYYLCKVFYDKDTPNDMRILEWVSSLDCFCIPYSEIRAYHYYVGKNNGEDVEVVYEWQKLDMRFRMETKWIEPY